jgi:hypothetical protein
MAGGASALLFPCVVRGTRNEVCRLLSVTQGAALPGEVGADSAGLPGGHWLPPRHARQATLRGLRASPGTSL